MRSLVAVAALAASLPAHATEKVAPGIISTEAVEYGAAIDPSDGSLYFVRTDSAWGEGGCGRILRSRRGPEGWAVAQEVFSGDACHADPFVSMDGARLYFASNEHADPERKDYDLWRSVRNGDGWGAPARLDRVNSTADEYSPVEAASGTLYFASQRGGGLGQGDLWRAAGSESGFMPPENLGAPVNTAAGEWNLLVAPDESFLIFEASGRPEGLSPSGDLYVSFAGDTGWREPQSLATLNTRGSDLMPRLSPDGKLLYYTSTGALRGGNADIHVTPLAPLLERRAAASGRMLAVVSRSDHELALVDEQTMTIAGRRETGRGPHEVAVAADGRHAFAPAYGVYPRPHAEPIAAAPPAFVEEHADTVRKIDLGGGTAHRDFRICARSHGVTVTPDGHVWVTCENEGHVLEIDPGSGNLVRRWPAQKGAHQLVHTPNGRHVVASNVESGSISIIDRERGVSRAVKTGAGAEGLAMAPDGRTVWVGNAQANTVSIVAVETGAIVDTVDSQGRFPVKLAFSADGGEVWAVNTFSRSVAIFDAATREPIENLSFDSPPLGIGFAPEGDRVYLTFPRLNEVRAFDIRTRRQLGAVGGIMEADGIAFIRLKNDRDTARTPSR